MRDEASYVCKSCGEKIVVPINLSAGEQEMWLRSLTGIRLIRALRLS